VVAKNRLKRFTNDAPFSYVNSMQNHAPPAFSKNTDRLNTPDLSENSVITPAIVQTNVESHKTMQTIEAVPNISEGQRPLILNKLATAVKRVKHAALLDLSADISHNRSVLTILGCPESVLQALTNLYEITTAQIDLRTHRGVHPRIGAIDVVPFIPIRNASMDDCKQLSRQLAANVASHFDIPTFLYGEAATQPGRKPLENIRRGQFEGLPQKMKDDRWAPDFGPLRPHPSAGASAIGAREPLIAFNVNLKTEDLAVARQIAAIIRAKNGGLAHVKALGFKLAHRGLVQVSVNLTDYRITPLHLVFTTIETEARKLEVEVVDSEIVGLVPQEAISDETIQRLRLKNFSSNKILGPQKIATSL